MKIKKFKYELIKCMCSGNFLKQSRKRLKKFIKSLPKRISKRINKKIAILGINWLRRSKEIEKDKIFVVTFRGEYDCNAKYICEEILKRNLPYRIVWTVRKDRDRGPKAFPQSFTFVQRGSYYFYKHLSSARLIIDNGVSVAFLNYKKKKGQTLIETWHGSLGIKKFSPSCQNDKHWVKTAFKEAKMTDYIISNSTFEDDVYREDYWKTTPIWRLGHARNDILCEGETQRVKEIRQKVYERLEIPQGAKICLYAPTFRDDLDMSSYITDYERLRDALVNRFGGEWIILTRLHFRLLELLKDLYLPEFVIDSSRYSDIYEILICTDVGITDFSSWICDYMLLRRPGFIYATDAKDYAENERELFYPLTDLPFPVSYDMDQLISNIENFDNDTLVRRCDEFLEDKGCMDDGHAAERIVDKIQEIMEQK